MKAVMVIEMPQNCLDCPCSYTNGDWHYCQVNEDNTTLSRRDMVGKKPDWCPLRPLPEYKRPSEYGDSIIQYFKDRGFDECLETITGEKNESSNNNRT